MPEYTDAIFKQEDFEYLRVIAHRSSEEASHVISKWLKHDVTIKVSNVNITTVERVGENLNIDDDIVFATATELVGDIKGHYLFIFKMEDAFKMADMILKRPIGTTKTTDEVVQSVILETCNIVGSSFSNSLVRMLSLQLMPSAPSICCDIGGAVMASILAEYACLGNELFFIDTEYWHKESKIEGYFFVLPTPDSIPLILNKIAGGRNDK